MHMADALIAPAVAGTMYACSLVTGGYAGKKLDIETDPKKIPMMGIMGAFTFATQMINFTIPGTGSSGHLCGAMLLSAILGPYAGFLTMMGVLLIQALLFADGGLLAYGCNVWNMAFYGCFIGGMVIWKNMMKKGFSKKKIWIASVLGSIISLQLGAFSVTLETLVSGITELPFSLFVMSMQPIHLAIGFVEGMITATVLCFLYEARPELLYGGDTEKEKAGRLSLVKTWATLLIATFMIAGGLSLYASSNPDGLEWSMEKVVGTSELEAKGSSYETARLLQDKTALLPDYALPNQESKLGTSISGIVGSVVVIFLCVGGCTFVNILKRKKKNESIKCYNS